MKGSIQKRKCGFQIATLIGIPVLALLITILFFHSYGDSFREFMIAYAWSLAICATQWLGNSFIYGLLDKKYSWEEHLVKRAILGSLALITYSATAFMLVQVIMYHIVVGSLPENPVSWGLRSSYVAILISFIVSLFFVAVGFFQNWKKSLLETERFKAEMLQYKYEALQNQINPHFLFNSFNVLSDLVYEDKKKAVSFINQLSHLFRYVLDSREKELVPIKEELEFIDAYSSLLQTRFEDKLIIQQDFRAKEQEMIVPMTLQLLIENSVKHNEISSGQPLTIRISRNKQNLRVENNLQLKTDSADSKGTGILNIKQQFSFFTNKQVQILENDKLFAVEVPIIKWEEE